MLPVQNGVTLPCCSVWLRKLRRAFPITEVACKRPVVRVSVGRLELTLRQVAELGAARDAALVAEPAAPVRSVGAAEAQSPTAATFSAEGAGARLLRLKGVGPETAAVLCFGAFRRSHCHYARWQFPLGESQPEGGRKPGPPRIDW